jgi:hypothetical protein
MKKKKERAGGKKVAVGIALDIIICSEVETEAQEAFSLGTDPTRPNIVAMVQIKGYASPWSSVLSDPGSSRYSLAG